MIPSVVMTCEPQNKFTYDTTDKYIRCPYGRPFTVVVRDTAIPDLWITAI